MTIADVLDSMAYEFRRHGTPEPVIERCIASWERMVTTMGYDLDDDAEASGFLDDEDAWSWIPKSPQERGTEG